MSKGVSNKTIRNIFFFFLLCLSVSFLITNTNKAKVLTQKIKNLMPRHLTENEQKSEKSSKICEKTSSKLNEYFKTGDKTKLGLDEDNTEKYDEYYIEALINMVKHYYDKKKEKQNKELRILGDDSQSGYMKNIFQYAYHILPLLIIFGLGILSLVAWIVWCCCTCYKCKCCVCKVPKCKTPSTVLGLIFYVIVALISFYALTEQNKIFSGLADTECAVLKFTDQLLYGEVNRFPPFWAGIDKIIDILDEFKTKTQGLNGVATDFTNKKNDRNNKKTSFENALDNGSVEIYDSNKYKSSYSGHNYQLDIANQYGSKTTPAENSVYKLWKEEYGTIYSRADESMTSADDSFDNIFSGNSNSDFDIAKNKMAEIKKEFISLKNLISDEIVKKADDVDRIGNIVYTLFFTLLIMLCAAIIVFMLLLCCCSGELCTNLSCCQCFCKFFLHFFWNLMAFIMFVLFMGGSMFTISGTLGGDFVNVVSYLISKDNLGDQADTVILGNVKQYLNKCFNDNGKILTELGLVPSDMESFEKLKQAQLEIEELKSQFNDKLYKFVYSEYMEELEQRINYKSQDLKLVALSDGDEPIQFQSLLGTFNEYASNNGKKESWSIESTSEDNCGVSHTNEVSYHPKNCYPTDKSWSSDSDTNLQNAKVKLNYFRTMINSAKNTTDSNSMIKILEDLKDKYQEFLQAEIATLEKYIEKISILTNLTKDYTSEDDELFSFMNCRFIKDNVDVILYYLKNSFENDMFEVGVYLLIAAFAMPFGVSFTILLIMISNEEIEKNKKKEEEKEKKRQSIIIPPINGVKEEKDKPEGNCSEERSLKPKS